MNKERRVSGITLVALVITIIVLLILAGVSIAMLVGENGILGNAEKAIGKSENAQIEENITLADYENKITGGHIEGTRETMSLEGTQMKLLTRAEDYGHVDDKTQKKVGTYPLSVFTKTETEICNNYIEYDSTNGKYIIKKSGWYLINMYNSCAQFASGTCQMYFNLLINGQVITSCDLDARSVGADRNTDTVTVYLTKGYDITCSNQVVTSANNGWSQAYMKIFAMDK